MTIHTEHDRVLAEALVDALLTRGEYISVCYGEGDYGVRDSDDKVVIMDALGACNEEAVVVFNGEGRKEAVFQLIYGNGPGELIADHSANALCDSVWEELEPVRERLEG